MRYVAFIFLILSFTACINNKKIPEGIIGQNEMRKLMWELMCADAYVLDFVMKDSSRNQKQESAILYEKIFSLHSTTKETFQKSLAFYESRPDLLKTITDSLRNDEKRVANYGNYQKKSLTDSIHKKTELIKKPVEKKK